MCMFVANPIIFLSNFPVCGVPEKSIIRSFVQYIVNDGNRVILKKLETTMKFFRAVNTDKVV